MVRSGKGEENVQRPTSNIQCRIRSARRRFVAHLDKIVDGEVGERIGVLFSANVWNREFVRYIERKLRIRSIYETILACLSQLQFLCLPSMLCASSGETLRLREENAESQRLTWLPDSISVAVRFGALSKATPRSL